MKATTYTLLITVSHTDAAPSVTQLALQIRQGLEEGTRDHKGVVCATVTGQKGDHAAPPPGEFHASKTMHLDLRENP